MPSGARFTATFDLRFISAGQAGYLASLRKSETAQDRVARATKLAAAVGTTAASATRTQTTAATAAATATDGLAAAQTRASVAARTEAAALAAQSTALFKQAAAIEVVDAATAKQRRETLTAAKASASAAKALGAQDVAAAAAAGSMTKVAVAGRDADHAFGGAARRVGDFAKRTAGLAAIAATAGAALGFKSAITAAGNYDTALREVGAVSDTSGQKLQYLGAIARQAGLDTGVGATAATQAMGELAKAGVAAADIGPALKGTLQLAQAGGLEAAAASEAAANAMSSFGLAGRDATRVADAYANAANMTTADVGDFAMAMSQGSSAAKTAGLSFEDTTLALTLLAQNAVKGSDAGTSLKAAITQLASPTKAAMGVMDQYGLTFFDAAGNMKSVSDISGMLNTKLGKLTREQRLQALTTLAGTDGQRALGAMMGVTTAEAEKLRGELTKQGSAADTAKAKQGGYAGAMSRLKASLEEVKIAVGTPLIGALAKAGDAVSGLIRRMSSRGTFDRFGRGIGQIISAASGRTPVSGGQVTTTRTVRTGGMTRTETAGRQATGAEKIGAAIGKAGSLIKSGVSAAGAAFAVLRPQIAGFVKDVGPFWKNVLRPFLQGFGQGLLSTAKVVVTVGVVAFRVLGKALGFIGDIAGKLGLDKVFRVIGNVVSWFATGPLATVIKAAVLASKPFRLVASVVRAISKPMREAGSAGLKVGGVLLRVAGWIGGRVVGAFRGLVSFVGKLPGKVGGAVNSAAGAVGRFATRVGAGIGRAVGFFKGLPGKALSAISSLGSKLGGAVGRIAAGAAKIGKGIVDAIVNAIKSAPGAIVGAVGNLIPDSLKDAASAIIPGLRGGGTVRGYFTGGQVTPVNLASGELLAFPGGGTAMVPGGISAVDNVQTAVPVGTRVFTTHGQDLLAGGMSASQALASQMPNGYVQGGIVSAARAARRAGLSGSRAVLATAIAGPESGYRPTARLNNPPIEDSRGYWQINTLAHPWSRGQNLYDPNVNARAMARISSGGKNFRPWSGFTSGKYRTYMDRARRAVFNTRGGGDDSSTTTAADGSRTVTRVKRYGADPYRGGLLGTGEAARAGYDAALAGDTARGYRRFGDEFLKQLRSAYTEQLSSRYDRKEIAAKADKTITGKLGKSFASRLDGTAGGKGKLARLQRAVGAAQSIAARKLPYTYGGGHGRLGKGTPGFDCSGYVSAILGAGGWIKSPLAVAKGTGLYTLGQRGAGRFMTWGVRGSSGRQAHTMMKLGNTYWESGSGHGPRRVSGWSGRFDYRHMPGYKAGGTVRRALSKIPTRAPRPAKLAVARYGDEALRPSSPQFVGWGYVRGGTVKRKAKTTRIPGVAASFADRVLTDGFAEIDAALTQMATDRLFRLYSAIQKAASKGGSPKIVNRLRGTLDLIDRRLGFRAGRLVLRAQQTQQQSDAAAKGVDWSMRLVGLDASSPEGLQRTRAALNDDQVRIASQRRDYTDAIKIAKRMGPRGKDMLREMRERLAELRDAATEAAVKQVELARDVVAAAAARRSESAQRITDGVNAGMAMLEATQRVRRTSDSAGGLAERAYQTALLVPALQNQAAVERANAAALGSFGRSTEAQEALARAAQLSTDALNAVADSADLARQAQTKVVTDRIDATNFDASLADVIGDRYQLQARMSGEGDAALAARRADYFNQTVLPLLRRQESDLVEAVRVASLQGDTEAYREAVLNLEQKRNDILDRSLQVQEDIKSNTAPRTFGGSLAFEFGGASVTDLVLNGNGA